MKYKLELGKLTDRDRIDLLVEEYRVLHSLLLFRLAAMEQRIPFASGALATLLGGIPLLPAQARAPVLVGIPVALIWLLVTTLNHGRSKEDLLRRIDEIERMVNQLAGEDLWVFQSQHPSQGDAVGGRTGMGTNMAMLSCCLFMLVGCDFLFRAQPVVPYWLPAAYSAYLGVVAATLLASVWRLRAYRYRKSPRPLIGPLFRSRGSAP